MKSIITISREYGAGGGAIGRKVADRLGYYYCDRDMIMHAAMESADLSKEYFAEYDEKVPFDFGFGQSLFNMYSRTIQEELFRAQRNAVLKVASKGKCVIVGRNANAILQEFDRTLHVFISANAFFRLQHMKERLPELPEAKIADRMRAVDKARRKYCSYYTDTEFGNADYYDLCLKSSTYGIDGCADIICEIAGR
jgi:cytidylate kinase